MAYMTVPYPNAVPPETFATLPRRNFLDDEINAKLSALNLPPSPPCDDAKFLRRAYLDTIGTLPTAEEARAFLDDASPDKRDKVIDQLLSRPEFVDYWAFKWSDLLLLSGERLRPKALETYYNWIRQSVAENKPWDQFVREIVTASGSTHEYGAANFYALHQDPEMMAETVSQAFLGLSVNCAKCHNHPLEKWTNDQYYGFANLFSRVRAKGWGGDYRSGDGLRVVYTDTQGELIQPSRGIPQSPRPLDGESLPFDGTEDRRVPMARWLTSPENPYFTRAIVNRVWANFFGVGLVEAVDDMRLTNPASNEKLLDSAAKYLVEQKYDLKQLMRAILQSAAYQRASTPLPENQADERFYSRYYPKRLNAEVLLDAIDQVTGTQTNFNGIPAGTRAVQLPDNGFQSYFLTVFGRPEASSACECERSSEANLAQSLHLLNSGEIQGKLTAGNGYAASLGNDKARPHEIKLRELYLLAFSRAPAPDELSIALAHIEKNKDDPKRAYEDIVWALINTKEFLFNH
jgi:hypothetical protein